MSKNKKLHFEDFNLWNLDDTLIESPHDGDTLVYSEADNKWHVGASTADAGHKKENIDIASITGNQVTLIELPVSESEMVFVNGIAMSAGSGLDYTIVNKTITFNTGVLTSTGNVLVKYNY